MTWLSQHNAFRYNQRLKNFPYTWQIARVKSGLVTQETTPLPIVTPNNHKELLSLDAISSPLFPVILGLRWLQMHNPRIDWST